MLTQSMFKTHIRKVIIPSSREFNAYELNKVRCQLKKLMFINFNSYEKFFIVMPERKIQIEANLFSAPLLCPSLTRISFMRWFQMNSKFEMFYG